MPKSSENLWKFGKSSEISANFRKPRKRFKPVFEELKRFIELLENFGNSSKVIFRCSYDFQNFRKIFGSVRKFSENFGNGSKVIFRCFYDFFNFRKIFGNLWKSLESIGKFPDVIGNVRNGSQEFKSFGAGF